MSFAIMRKNAPIRDTLRRVSLILSKASFKSFTHTVGSELITCGDTATCHYNKWRNSSSKMYNSGEKIWSDVGLRRWSTVRGRCFSSQQTTWCDKNTLRFDSPVTETRPFVGRFVLYGRVARNSTRERDQNRKLSLGESVFSDSVTWHDSDFQLVNFFRHAQSSCIHFAIRLILGCYFKYCLIA